MSSGRHRNGSIGESIGVAAVRFRGYAHASLRCPTTHLKRHDCTRHNPQRCSACLRGAVIVDAAVRCARCVRRRQLRHRIFARVAQAAAAGARRSDAAVHQLPLRRPHGEVGDGLEDGGTVAQRADADLVLKLRGAQSEKGMI